MTIHAAQVKSLELVSQDMSPYEKDVLGISFEKGGTSVLTDGYLIAGDLSLEQAQALFGFGTFTQLMDDMEDVRTDIQENRASLFSISAPYWHLDQLCNRFFHFGRKTISALDQFDGHYASRMTNLISQCIDPMLLGSLSQSTGYFSKTYIHELETHLPFRFKCINRQHERLSNQQRTLIKLVEESLLAGEQAGNFHFGKLSG